MKIKFNFLYLLFNICILKSSKVEENSSVIVQDAEIKKKNYDNNEKIKKQLFNIICNNNKFNKVLDIEQNIFKKEHVEKRINAKKERSLLRLQDIAQDRYIQSCSRSREYKDIYNKEKINKKKSEK